MVVVVVVFGCKVNVVFDAASDKRILDKARGDG